MMNERKMGTKYLANMLAMILLMLSALSGLSVPSFAASSATMDVKIHVTYGQTEARAMLDYINKFRAGNDVDGQEAKYLNEDNSTWTDMTGKLKPLTYDYNLEKVAMQRAAEIAICKGHTRPDGTDCFTAWDGNGSWTGFGENLAYGYKTGYNVFVGWREDNDDYDGQGHRRTMLDSDLTRVGIGHVVYNGTHFWAQAFGRGTGSTTKTTATDSATDVTVSVKTSDLKNFVANTAPESYELQPEKMANLPVVNIEFTLPSTWKGATCNATIDATWTSDDTNVATVTNGKVKAVKAGTANLKTTVKGTTLKVPVTVKDVKTHTHTLTKTAAKSATCTTAGNSAYWTCKGCGKYFSDSKGTKEIEENSWVIKATGHTLTKTAAKAATETKAGNSAYWTCSTCGKYFSDSKGKTEIEKDSWVIPALGHTHTLTKTAAKSATCTTAGNSAYWTCKSCGKYFSDSKGTKEIEKNSWVIKATGHKLTKTAAKAATCTAAGNSAYWTCSTCKKYFSDSKGTKEIAKDSWVIKATGHKLTKTAAKEATCTEAGNSAYWTCSTCKKYFSDSKGTKEIAKNSWVIKAKGHKLTKTAAKAATETEAGNSAYWTCTTCNKYFSDSQGKKEIEKDSWIIPALGHTHKLTKTAAKAATCTKAGNSAYWTCKGCGKYFSDSKGTNEIAKDSWIIEATGHKLTKTASRAATCTSNGNSAYWTCSVCGKYYADANGTEEIKKNSWVIKATGHNLVKTPAKAATATQAGNKAYWTCTKCGKYYADEHAWTEIAKGSWVIPATGNTSTNTGSTLPWYKQVMKTSSYKYYKMVDINGDKKKELLLANKGGPRFYESTDRIEVWGYVNNKAKKMGTITDIGATSSVTYIKKYNTFVHLRHEAGVDGVILYKVRNGVLRKVKTVFTYQPYNDYVGNAHNKKYVYRINGKKVSKKKAVKLFKRYNKWNKEFSFTRVY